MTPTTFISKRDPLLYREENQKNRRLIKHALAFYLDVKAAREQMIDVADRDTN